MSISESLKSFFHDEGIHSTTIQPEFIEVNFRNTMSFLQAAIVEYGFIESKRLYGILSAFSI